jgi:hypothetical protein
MKARFIKPALLILIGIFIGMYFLHCGNDAGIGSDFDATKYYTKDQIDSLVHSVNDVNLDTVTGEIPGIYQGTIIKLYLKDLKHLQDHIMVKTGKSIIALTDVANTVQRLELKCETYDDSDLSIATFQRFRFARSTGNPAEDTEGIYWPIIVTDESNTQDGSPTYKLIYVTALMK